jgi:Zn-dependent protease with chaperone function
MNRANLSARALAAFAAVCISGCATNTITGRSQLMMVSEQSAIASSVSAYSRFMGGQSQKGKVESGTPRVQNVKAITDKLIAQAVRFRPDSAAWSWEVQVIDDPKVVNAFCMAGGKMAIYTGFWEKLQATDDEIAAVMGHEIGHALASHTREKMSVGLSAQIGATVAAALLSRGNPGNFAQNQNSMQNLAAVAVTLPNSREAENEADQIGIELAARAGFDPRGAVSVWQKMQGQRDKMPEFLSTHPSHETRIQNLSALVPKVDPLYQMAKAGKSTDDVPTFLAKGNESARASYAEKVSAEPEAMTFVSEEFQKFRRGELILDCSFSCAMSYAYHRGDWPALHAKKAWRELVVSIVKVGHPNDLSYFLLAEAAAGMKLEDAARVFYQRSLAAAAKGDTCAGGLVDTCGGFDIKTLATAALQR